MEINDYIITRNGTVISRGRILKPQTNSAGYTMYFLAGKWRLIHRLVYERHAGEITKGMEINHIDGDKSNNHIDNLQLTTHADNIKHSYKLGRAKPTHRKTQSATTRAKQREAKLGRKHPKFKGFYTFNGMQFDSAAQAEQITGINRRSIIRWAKKNINNWGFSTI